MSGPTCPGPSLPSSCVCSSARFLSYIQVTCVYATGKVNEDRFFFVFHSTFWLCFTFSFVTSTLSLSSRLGGVFHQNNPCCVRKRRTSCRTFFFSACSLVFLVVLMFLFSLLLSRLCYIPHLSPSLRNHIWCAHFGLFTFFFFPAVALALTQSRQKKRLLFPFFLLTPISYSVVKRFWFLTCTDQKKRKKEAKQLFFSHRFVRH